MNFRAFARIQFALVLAVGVVLCAGRAVALTESEIHELVSTMSDANLRKESRIKAVRYLAMAASMSATSRDTPFFFSSESREEYYQNMRRSEKAASALELAALENTDVQEVLVSLAQDSNYKIRASVAASLARVAPINPRARVALRTLARDSNRSVSDRAIYSLGQGAISHPQIRDDLIELTRSSDANTRVKVVDKLGRISSDDAMVSIISLADDRSAKVRVEVAKKLAGYVSKSAESRAALLELLNDSDPKVRIEAAGALRYVGNKYDDVRLALISRVQDSNARVRSSVIDGLSRAAHWHADARASFLVLAGDSNSDVRRGVVFELGSLAFRHSDARVALFSMGHFSSGNIAESVGSSVSHLLRTMHYNAPADQRPAILSDAFNALTEINLHQTLVGPIEEALAVQARRDPEFRLLLLRRAAGLDTSFWKVALTRSRDRWRGAAIRILHRTYDPTFDSWSNQVRGVYEVMEEAVSYRDSAIPTRFQDTPEIMAFLAKRNRFAPVNPRGPGRAERALLNRITQYFASGHGGRPCLSLADTIR